MKKSYLILFFSIFTFSLFSQAPDSLNILKRLDNLQNEAKLHKILEISGSIYSPNKQIVPYLNWAVEFTKEKGLKNEYAKTLKLMGLVYFYNGEIFKSILYSEKAVLFYLSLNKKKFALDAYNLIANNYFYLNWFDKAVFNNLKMLELANELHQMNKIATANRQLGINYLYLKQYKEGLKYLKDSLKIALKNDFQKSSAYSYSDLGMYYFFMKKFDKSLEYQKKALTYCNHSLSFEHPRTLIYQRLASSYLAKKKFAKARFYILLALNNKRIIKQLNISYEILAKIYIEEKKYNSALQYLEKANKLSVKSQNYIRLNELYNLYLKIFRQKNNLNRFLYYSNLKNKNLQKLKEFHLQNQLANINIQFQIQKFKKKNKLLFEQNKMNKIEIHYFKIIFVLLVFILILLIFIAIRQYQFRKNEKNKNKLISKQKKIIQIKAERLENKSRELLKHKDKLEELVIERTKELEKAKEKAEESDKLKTEFLQNMSHEIRTPLNAVLGFSELLISINSEKEIKNNEETEYLSVIHKSGKQLLKIFTAIMDMSRLQTEIINVEINEIQVSTMLQNLFSLYKEEAEKKNLNFIISRLSQDSKLTLHSDKEKINRILSVFLENAIKYTKEGTIELGFLEKQDSIEFYVKDTGIGVDEKNQKIIFYRFSQEHKTLEKNTGGLGLGLSIAKKYADLIQGKIHLQSQKNKGAVFFLTLYK